MNFPYPDFVNKKNIMVKEEPGYRYYLSIPFITVGNPNTLAVIMKNPSTADAFLSDNTADRVCKFAYHHKFGRLIIVNLFAYRTSDAKLLKQLYDEYGLDYLIGQENNSHIKTSVNEASKVFIAWGTPPSNFKQKYDKRIDQVQNLLHGNTLYYVGSLSGGKYPLHGLRWSNDKAVEVI